MPEPAAGGETAHPSSDKHQQKAGQVARMFDRIAGTYDLLNDCISLGLHRGWKKQACTLLQLTPGSRVLDVCTGTGDLAGRLSRIVGPGGQVDGLDFSEEMLAVARTRFADLSNTCFTQGDATALPYEDNAFDGAIISFGLRNVVDIPRTLSEMARVVRPGGWVVNLDTCPEPKLPGYWLYFKYVMPMAGRLLSMDPGAYSYLSESTQHFLTPAELKQAFETAGLANVRVKTLAFDSVSIQAGQKPMD